MTVADLQLGNYLQPASKRGADEQSGQNPAMAEKGLAGRRSVGVSDSNTDRLLKLGYSRDLLAGR